MCRFDGRVIKPSRKEHADQKAALGHCQLLSLQGGNGKHGGCQVGYAKEYLEEVQSFTNKSNL